MPGTAHRPERERHTAKLAVALAALYAAIRDDVIERWEAGRRRGLIARLWSRRLTEAVHPLIVEAAAEVGQLVAAELSDDPTFDPADMDHYLEEMAANFGRDRLEAVRLEIEAQAGEIVEELDEFVATSERDAEDLVNGAANFASLDAAKAEGMGSKTWSTGENPRASHAALDGVRVPIDERFPNGLRYPRSPGPPQETVNCNCTMTFGR